MSSCRYRVVIATTKYQRRKLHIYLSIDKKINYMLVVGNKEMELGGVAVRSRDEKDLGLMKVEDFIAKAQGEVENKE